MDFMELASQRFSVRSFSDKPVEQEKIDLVLKAAQLAPTAVNYQPQMIYQSANGENGYHRRRHDHHGKGKRQDARTHPVNVAVCRFIGVMHEAVIGAFRLAEYLDNHIIEFVYRKNQHKSQEELREGKAASETVPDR